MNCLVGEFRCRETRGEERLLLERTKANDKIEQNAMCQIVSVMGNSNPQTVRIHLRNEARIASMIHKIGAHRSNGSQNQAHCFMVSEL